MRLLQIRLKSRNVHLHQHISADCFCSMHTNFFLQKPDRGSGIDPSQDRSNDVRGVYSLTLRPLDSQTRRRSPSGLPRFQCALGLYRRRRIRRWSSGRSRLTGRWRHHSGLSLQLSRWSVKQATLGWAFYPGYTVAHRWLPRFEQVSAGEHCSGFNCQISSNIDEFVDFQWVFH